MAVGGNGITRRSGWMRLWAALSSGTFLGSSAVPVFVHRIRSGESWGDSIGYGVENACTEWCPTFLVFSAVFFVALFVAWKTDKVT